MVATPTYTGDLNHRYVESLMAALLYCAFHKVQLELRIVAGASLIQYARNQLVREFLEDPTYTHLMWIDADVGFDPRAIMRLLDHDKAAVGGVYPMKCNPIEWPYEPLPGEQSTELHRAKIMPGGFLLVTRAAVQAVADASTEYIHHMAGMKYPTKHVFDVVLRDGVLLGEDVIFAQRLAAAGFDLWVDPDMPFAHVGAQQWRGNLADTLRRGYAENPPLDGRAVRSLATAAVDELAEPIDALFKQWGYSWAAPPAELVAMAALAKRSAMILECGPGLSSIVMAAANPAARIHALESDPVWCERIINEARRHGLTNLTVHLTPLDPADWFYTIPADLPPGPYDLAVIDGPVWLDNTHLAHSSDTRRPAFTKLAGRLAGAVLVVDDCEHYRDVIAGYVHEEVGGRFAICLPNAAAEAAA